MHRPKVSDVMVSEIAIRVGGAPLFRGINVMVQYSPVVCTATASVGAARMGGGGGGGRAFGAAAPRRETTTSSSSSSDSTSLSLRALLRVRLIL